MTKKTPKEPIGWREWIKLPDLNVKKIKVKVDTGARTSALHAEDIEFFSKRGKKYVRFTVLPEQKSTKGKKVCEAELIESRKVRSSVGHSTKRPVIKTQASFGDYECEIEVTLVNRDIMGFRMLLGRQAIRGHFLVDPGKSYIVGEGKPKKTKSKAKIVRRTK